MTIPGCMTAGEIKVAMLDDMHIGTLSELVLLG